MPRNIFDLVMDIVFHTVDDLRSGVGGFTHWITNGGLVDGRLWPREWGNWRRLGYRPPALPDIFGVHQRVPRGPTPRSGPGGWRYGGRADFQNAIQEAVKGSQRRGIHFTPHDFFRDSFRGASQFARPPNYTYRLWERDSDPLVYDPDLYRVRVAPWTGGPVDETGRTGGFYHGLNMMQFGAQP